METEHHREDGQSPVDAALQRLPTSVKIGDTYLVLGCGPPGTTEVVRLVSPKGVVRRLHRHATPFSTTWSQEMSPALRSAIRAGPVAAGKSTIVPPAVPDGSTLPQLLQAMLTPPFPPECLFRGGRAWALIEGDDPSTGQWTVDLAGGRKFRLGTAVDVAGLELTWSALEDGVRHVLYGPATDAEPATRDDGLVLRADVPVPTPSGSTRGRRRGWARWYPRAADTVRLYIATAVSSSCVVAVAMGRANPFVVGALVVSISALPKR